MFIAILIIVYKQSWSKVSLLPKYKLFHCYYSLTASDGDFKYFYNPCYGVSMDVESGSCTGSDEMAVSSANLLMVTQMN